MMRLVPYKRKKRKISLSMNMYPRKAYVNTKPEGTSEKPGREPSRDTKSANSLKSWIVINEFVFLF